MVISALSSIVFPMSDLWPDLTAIRQAAFNPFFKAALLFSFPPTRYMLSPFFLHWEVILESTVLSDYVVSIQSVSLPAAGSLSDSVRNIISRIVIKYCTGCVKTHGYLFGFNSPFDKCSCPAWRSPCLTHFHTSRRIPCREDTSHLRKQSLLIGKDKRKIESDNVVRMYFVLKTLAYIPASFSGARTETAQYPPPSL